MVLRVQPVDFQVLKAPLTLPEVVPLWAVVPDLADLQQGVQEMTDPLSLEELVGLLQVMAVAVAVKLVVFPVPGI